MSVGGIRHIPRVSEGAPVKNKFTPQSTGSHIPRFYTGGTATSIANTLAPIAGMIPGVGTVASVALPIAGGVIDMIAAANERKAREEEEKRRLEAEKANARSEYNKQGLAAESSNYFAEQAADMGEYNAIHKKFNALAQGGYAQRNEGPDAEHIYKNPYRNFEIVDHSNDEVPSYLFGGEDDDDQGGYQYDYQGNTANNSYVNKPWDSLENISDNIQHNEYLGPIMKGVSHAFPFALSLHRPLLGNLLNVPISLGAGNPIGAGLSGLGLAQGMLRGKSPFNEPGAIHGFSSLYDIMKNKYSAKASSVPGMINIFTGLAQAAPIAASWATPRLYQPTLGLSNTHW